MSISPLVPSRHAVGLTTQYMSISGALNDCGHRLWQVFQYLIGSAAQFSRLAEDSRTTDSDHCWGCWLDKGRELSIIQFLGLYCDISELNKLVVGFRPI